MKITDELQGKIAVFKLSGKIMGGDSSTLFHGQVHQYVNNNIRLFVIDLGKVEWINSVGLGMLISALVTVTNAEGKLALANITNIESIMSMTRLIRVFEHHDSLEEAIKALSA